MFRTAVQLGLNNGELALTVAKLGVHRFSFGIGNRAIEPSEKLLERAVEALRMAAGQIGIRAGAPIQQRRVLQEDLIAFVAPADPKLVRIFGVPGNGSECAEDFEKKTVLAAAGNLTRRERASGSVSHSKENRPKVFCIHFRIDGIELRSRAQAKCLCGLFGFRRVL